MIHEVDLNEVDWYDLYL